MRRLGALCLAAAFALTATQASGWDVGQDAHEGWKSIYVCGVADVPVDYKKDAAGKPIYNTGSLHTGDKKILGNEHAEIADHVLFLISAELGKKFGTAACKSATGADANCPRMVDLNASWLRRGVVHPQPKQGQPDPDEAGDWSETTLRERRFPPIAMWSSLPDFAYTVYDWINARRLCPALPQDADQRKLCHVYTAWLGAGLNSTHFGHLPLRVYARYHQIALNLAARASQLRTTLKGGGADQWHKDYILELERLALAYEMTGQHFAQDRWASGHMIARWGAGSYEELPRVNGNKPELRDAVMTGVLTGMLHGSQAVFHHPDPLGAPLLESEAPPGFLKFLMPGAPATKGTFARWRYTVDNAFSKPTQTQECVGDYLFKPLMTSSYGGAEGVPVNPPLSTAGSTNQKKGMVYCTAQGIRQVIAAFGANDASGTTFGMHALPLAEPDKAELQYEWVPGAERLGKNPALDPLCNSQWVTNDSWYMGLRTIAGKETLIEDAVVVLKSALIDPAAPYTPPAWRVGPAYTLARLGGLAQVRYDQEHRKRKDGSGVDYGVELAEDGVSLFANSFWWEGNQVYSLPSYYEPADLDTLPDLDPVYGRDKAAVYGLFNKGSVEHWCKESLSKDPVTAATTGRLAELRDQIVSTVGDDETRNVLTAACSYLAERVHKRTDPAYDGPRNELMGEHLPYDQTPKHGPSYEPVCKYLDASGLIATSDANDDTRPYLLHPGYVVTPGKKGPRGHAAESLENWCKKLPVFDVTVASKSRDIVYTINETSTRWIELKGRNFGKKTPSGKTGQVLAKSAVSGQWQPLDVWDEATKSEKGGWSDDGKVMYARLPPSKKGFPTLATAQMAPHQLLALAPLPVELRLVRANDPTAKLSELLSDGAETVGEWTLDLEPQVLQVQWGPVAPGTQEIRAEFCHPIWLRPDIELLAKGVYRLQNGAYTKLDTVPFTWHDDIPWQPDPAIVCDPANERAGATLPNPDPTVFDGSAVFVFAYH